MTWLIRSTVRCTESRPRRARGAVGGLLALSSALLGGCLGGGQGSWRGAADAPSNPSPARSAPAATGGAVPDAPAAAAATPGRGGASATPARPAAPRMTVVRPPMPARPARTAAEYQRQMARHLTDALPGMSYATTTPDVLLAIPVLSVELNADGSVRAVDVLRRPGQALDTLQMAIDAVRAAAPYPPVGHLPRPWKFNQVFLYNDQRLFKLQVLDVR